VRESQGTRSFAGSRGTAVYAAAGYARGLPPEWGDLRPTLGRPASDGPPSGGPVYSSKFGSGLTDRSQSTPEVTIPTICPSCQSRSISTTARSP